jgi:hypothetical protein
MLTQEQYIGKLKAGIAKHGLRGYAKILGIDYRRLHDEVKGDYLDRKYGRYGKHSSNIVLEALGLRRVQTVRYERVPRSEKEATVGKQIP